MRHHFNVVPRLQDDTGGHSPKGVTLSYNITAWRIADLQLALPKDFDFRRWLEAQPVRDERGYENVGRRWCLEEKDDCRVLLDQAARTWELSLSGIDMGLKGVIGEDGKLEITEIVDWRGDCSGILYSDILI